MSGATASPTGQALHVQRRSWGQAATPSRRVRCGRCQGWARLRLRGPSGSPEPEEKALAQGPTADSWPLLPDRPRATLEGLLASLMHSVSPEAPQPRFPLSLQAPVPLLPPPRSPPAPAQIEHGAPKAPASPSSWPCLSLSCDFFLLSTKQGLSPSEVTRLREHARLHSPSGEAPGLQSPLRPPGGLPRHRLGTLTNLFRVTALPIFFGDDFHRSGPVTESIRPDPRPPASGPVFKSAEDKLLTPWAGDPMRRPLSSGAATTLRSRKRGRISVQS